MGKECAGGKAARLDKRSSERTEVIIESQFRGLVLHSSTTCVQQVHFLTHVSLKNVNSTGKFVQNFLVFAFKKIVSILLLNKIVKSVDNQLQ